MLSSGFPSGGEYSGNGVINNVLYPDLLNVGKNMITYARLVEFLIVLF